MSSSGLMLRMSSALTDCDACAAFFVVLDCLTTAAPAAAQRPRTMLGSLVLAMGGRLPCRTGAECSAATREGRHVRIRGRHTLSLANECVCRDHR